MRPFGLGVSIVAVKDKERRDALSISSDERESAFAGEIKKNREKRNA